MICRYNISYENGEFINMKIPASYNLVT